MDHGAELLGNVAEALAVVGVVNLVHYVLEAFHFGGRGPGSCLQHSQSAVALGCQLLEGVHRLADCLRCKVGNNIFQHGVAFAGVLGLLPGVLHSVAEPVGCPLCVFKLLPVLAQFSRQAADPACELLGLVGAFALFEHEVGVFPLQCFEIVLLLAYGTLQRLVCVGGVVLRVDQVSGGPFGRFEGVAVFVQLVAQVLDPAGELPGLVGAFPAAHDIVSVSALQAPEHGLLSADLVGQPCGSSGAFQRFLAHFLQPVNSLPDRLL